MLDLNAVCQPEKGIFGLQLGKNNFQIAFRILSRFDSQVPQFFVVQTVEER